MAEETSASTAARRLERAGRRLLGTLNLLRELGAFTVITLTVGLAHLRPGGAVIRRSVIEQIRKSGVRLLPMVALLAVALGIVILGQTLAVLTSVGAQRYIGMVMVAVVLRELGPLLTAILVVARSGTVTVVELGTVRALGEVEALESLGIDPIHYLVVPRVIALAVSVFCLTMYFVAIAVVTGCVFAFFRDVPLTPEDYFAQLAENLRWQDFALLVVKTSLCGVIIGVVSCYHGLARRVGIDEVSQRTSRAVVESVAGCALLDAAFLAGYVFT